MERNMYKKMILGIFASVVMSVCVCASGSSGQEQLNYRLFLAVTSGKLNSVQESLADRPDGMVADRNMHLDKGGSLLIVAAKNNFLSIVEELIKKPGINFERTDSSGMTALMYAAQRGDLAMVEKLIGAGASIDRPRYAGIDKMTALMYAAQECQLAVVRKLAEEGANTEQASDNGWVARQYAAVKTPFDSSKYSDCSKIVSLLDPEVEVQWQGSIVKKNFPFGTTIDGIKTFFASSHGKELVKSTLTPAIKLLTVSPDYKEYMKVNVNGQEICDDQYKLSWKDKNVPIVVWITGQGVLGSVCKRLLPGRK